MVESSESDCSPKKEAKQCQYSLSCTRQQHSSLLSQKEGLLQKKALPDAADTADTEAAKSNTARRRRSDHKLQQHTRR